MPGAGLNPSKRRRSTGPAASASSSIAIETRSPKPPMGHDSNILVLRFRRWRKHGLARWRLLNVMPSSLRAIVIAAAALGFLVMTNIFYHVVRKPTELFFAISGSLNKTPLETWRQYAPLFKEYSTATITPDLLAALAQVESAGNPIARTYWRWRLTWNPFEIYRPASSAVGMFQLTDAILADAGHHCIRNHIVIEEGAWYDWRSCWLNRFRSRAVPSHAIELTAVSLDRKVTKILSRRRHGAATLQQKQDLAVVAHLCGAGPGAAFARRGFQLGHGERCGDHDVAAYLAQVNTMKRQFRGLAASTEE
jgi:Transglycosylase SLT domain